MQTVVLSSISDNVALTGRPNHRRRFFETRLSKSSLTQVFGNSATVKCLETLDGTYL